LCLCCLFAAAGPLFSWNFSSFFVPRFIIMKIKETCSKYICILFHSWMLQAGEGCRPERRMRRAPDEESYRPQRRRSVCAGIMKA
jgi:hypothetical protein